MIEACPHCGASLRPGEAYLGWCGECGENFFREPTRGARRERPGPLTRGRSPEAAAPVPEEWYWVARGVLVKLVALLVGMAGAFLVGSAADWDWNKSLAAPPARGVGLLVAAAALDVIGRLLCLGTPQASTRTLVIVSVVAQLAAVVAAVGCALAAPDEEGRAGLLASAVLCQLAAAVTFTVYLFAVGVYFRSPLVMGLSVLLSSAMQGAAGVAVFFGALLAVAAIVFVVGVFLCFVCPPLGVGVMMAGGEFGKAVAAAFAYSMAVVLLVVEVAYALTLAALVRQLWRRRVLAR